MANHVDPYEVLQYGLELNMRTLIAQAARDGRQLAHLIAALKRGLVHFPSDRDNIWSEVDHTQVPMTQQIMRERRLLDENMFLKECLNWFVARLGFLEMTYADTVISPKYYANEHIPNLVHKIQEYVLENEDL